MMKRAAIALGITVAFALAYLGFTWNQRRDATLHMLRAARSGRPLESGAPAGPTGTAVRITQFYARSNEMTDADRNLICYGVENATTVRIDPPIENLFPSRNRCIWAEPKRNTTYTLYAEGADGSRESASLDLRVGPAPPHIQFVAVSHAVVHRGDAVTVCYGVDRASRVRLDPVGLNLPAVARNCTRFYPRATFNYTLSAFGVEGQTDREKFSIRVK